MTSSVLAYLQGYAMRKSLTFLQITQMFWKVLAQYDTSWGTRVGVHFGLFAGAIQGQGTEEMVRGTKNVLQQLRQRRPRC